MDHKKTNLNIFSWRLFLLVISFILIGILFAQFLSEKSKERYQAADRNDQSEVDSPISTNSSINGRGGSIVSTLISTADNEPTSIVSYPEGWLMYRTMERLGSAYSYPGKWLYFLMDGEGNRIDMVWTYRGAPAWSPDGTQIAVSCDENVYQLCFIDVSSIPTPQDYIATEIVRAEPRSSRSPIDLPYECDGLVSDEGGLESISWSNDGQFLAVVCGINWYNSTFDNIDQTERIVCIVSYEDGTSTCWRNFEYTVDQATWSPVEDVILISLAESEPGIYIATPQGEIISYLNEGVVAEWSPDGQKIAEIINKQGLNNGGGIAIVNKDGTDFTWVYRNDYSSEDYHFNIRTESEFGYKLTWSPDGKYLAFQGDKFNKGSFEIYRLNIQTAELVCLSCFNNIYYRTTSPDWGPPIDR